MLTVADAFSAVEVEQMDDARSQADHWSELCQKIRNHVIELLAGEIVFSVEQQAGSHPISPKTLRPAQRSMTGKQADLDSGAEHLPRRARQCFKLLNLRARDL